MSTEIRRPTTAARYPLRMGVVWEYRWAHERGAHGMITVEEAEYFGYVRVVADPRYPASWLMRRQVESA